MDGRLSGGAAIGWWLIGEAYDGIVEHLEVVGMKHRLHCRDAGMGAKRLHGAEYHGLAADRSILLRAASAGAKPPAGGGPLRISHKTQLLGSDQKVGQSPYHAAATKTRENKGLFQTLTEEQVLL